MNPGPEVSILLTNDSINSDRSYYTACSYDNSNDSYCIKFKNKKIYSELMIAIMQEKPIYEIISLINNKTINYHVKGETALSIAVDKNNIDIVRLLIEKGANTNIKLRGEYLNESGLLVLRNASRQKNICLSLFM